MKWNECSHSCGTGVRSRYRVCSLSLAADAQCTRPDIETEFCFTFECPREFYYLLRILKKRTNLAKKIHRTV